MTEFKITKPGEYLTRDGKKAVVLCVDAPDQHYPVIGYKVLTEQEVQQRSWTDKGFLYADGNDITNCDDIISEWKEPEKPQIHEWWQALIDDPNEGIRHIMLRGMEKPDASDRTFIKYRLTINPDGTKDIEIVEKVWR